MIVDIDTIREHLRLEPLDTNYTEDDERENEYIEMLYDTAVDYINNYLEDDIETKENLPKSIKTCLLLIVADLYEHREAQTDKQLYTNDLVDKILHIHRRNLGI